MYKIILILSFLCFSNLKASNSTLLLTEKNTIVLRGPITEESATKIQLALLQSYSDSDIILVLDTPGGSVDAGLQIIEVANGLSKKVHTLTIFAASMGFQLAQNLGTRYIINYGTLMSHRATITGLGGQFDGELESRYKYLKSDIDQLDIIAATRMNISVADYKALIKDEYWVKGYQAVTDKAADLVVNVSCSRILVQTTEKVTINTFFGTYVLTYSKCPLVTYPVSIDSPNNKFLKYLLDNTLFVKGLILSGKFDTLLNSY